MSVDFLVRRDDLTETRLEDADDAPLEPGGARLEVERFALTANNVTYGVLGDALSYWNFFPAPEGWGRIPAFGFARVIESRADALATGSRYFGYFPMSTRLVVNPTGITEGGFVDGSDHRAEMSAVYNRYLRVDNDPRHEQRYEDRQMLMRPLFTTAWLIDDWLDDEGFFDADVIAISSASSKTSIGTAYCLGDREVGVVGLTSAANRDFVGRLDPYDSVVTYDEVESLPLRRTVYLDVSGSGSVRGAVHRHLGDQLAFSSFVGGAHWDHLGDDPGELPGPAPQMFFAPARIDKRGAEWGNDGLMSRIADSWGPFVRWSEEWLEVEHGSGPDAVKSTYRKLLDGDTSPARGHVLSMSA